MRPALSWSDCRSSLSRSKPGGNAEVDHDHVGGLGEIVADGDLGGGDVILGQLGAVVGDVHGERLGGGPLLPGSEGAADDLVGEAAGAFKLELHGVGLLCVDALEDELMQQVVVLRGEGEGFNWLAVEDDLKVAADIGSAALRGEQKRAQGHDGGLGGAPVAGGLLLRGDEVERLADGLVACPRLSSAWAARPVVSMAALAPVE